MPIYKYRVRCTTDDAWETVLLDSGEPEPTTCPVDPISHTIDSALTSIIEKTADDPPATSDGRPINISTRFRKGIDPFFAGSFDDNIPGDGDLCQISWDPAPTGVEDKQQEGGYRDWCEISKGKVFWQNGGPGDHVGVLIFAPTTVVTVNGGSTGNCNTATYGPGNIIVPAAGDGGHDVDLALASIVPAAAGDGYWEWDKPDTGRGTVTPGTPGGSAYHLFDFQTPLVRWAKKIALIGSAEHIFEPETDTRILLPHWKVRVEVHNESLGKLCVSWFFSTGRSSTVS